jgi:D-alanyl-D-alanine carboxypeptidase
MQQATISTALGVVLLGATAIAGVQLFEGKQLTQELQNTLASTTINLETVTLEKNELAQKLAEKEATVEELNKNFDRLDKKTDELKKLARTDKELLEKYSKVYFLNEHYTPSRLNEIDSKYLTDKNRTAQIHAQVRSDLENLIDDADNDDVALTITSAYRSFNTQATLKTGYTVTYGAGTANQFSAEQGYSEHQLGTAVDFGTPGSSLTVAFENTKAFKWLTENAYRYGFVLSYPKGNIYYQYEPWHWRFVGKDLARKLHREGKYFYDLDQREINKFLVDIFD